jgi:hypothetical protein
VIDDTRAIARMLLDTNPPTRAAYIAAVMRDALKKHGDRPEVRMHAERTARYQWSRRKATGEDGGVR